MAAGITDMIFITGRNKRAIEDHFDKAYELETELRAQGKDVLLDMVRSVLPEGVSCIYIRQAEPLGLGHAVLCAQPVVGDEPFAVHPGRRPDRRAAAGDAQMVEIFAREQRSLLGVQEVPRDETRQLRHRHQRHDARATGAHAQASWRSRRPEEAPSTLAVVGRYVLTPRIFDMLERGEARRRRRDPAHRRASRALLEHERVLAVRLPGPALRLRLEARLPAGDGRLRRCGIPRSARSSARYLKSSLEREGMPDRASEAWAFLEDADLIAQRRRSAGRRSTASAAEIERRARRALSAGAGGDGRRGGVHRAAAAAAALSARVRLHRMPRATARRRAARGVDWRVAPAGASCAGARCWCSTTSSTRARRWRAIRERLLELGAEQRATARCWPTRTLGREKPIRADFVGAAHPRPLRVRLRHGRARASGATCPRSAPEGMSRCWQSSAAAA